MKVLTQPAGVDGLLSTAPTLGGIPITAMSAHAKQWPLSVVIMKSPLSMISGGAADDAIYYPRTRRSRLGNGMRPKAA
jgi:hypothetical protein